MNGPAWLTLPKKPNTINIIRRNIEKALSCDSDSFISKSLKLLQKIVTIQTTG